MARKHLLSAENRRLLRRHASLTTLAVNELYDEERRLAESHDTIWQVPVEHDLVLFGCTGSGDAFALDLRCNERVVLLAHDLLWGERVSGPRKAMVVVAPSLAQALSWARESALPVDYYEALDLRARLRRAPRKAHALIRHCCGRGFTLGFEVAVPLEAFALDRKRIAAPSGCPLPGTRVFPLLERLQRRANVNVLMRISDLGTGWPRTDAVFLQTRATLSQARAWLEPLEPSFVVEGWRAPLRPGGDARLPEPEWGIPALRKGWRVYTASWNLPRA